MADLHKRVLCKHNCIIMSAREGLHSIMDIGQQKMRWELGGGDRYINRGPRSPYVADGSNAKRAVGLKIEKYKRRPYRCHLYDTPSEDSGL